GRAAAPPPGGVRARPPAGAEPRGGGGPPAGIKVSGGVRTADDALEYLEIVRAVLGDDWLVPERLRFGASSLLSNVVAELAASAAG
ncbi:MAG: hypothetical protein OXC00_15035, partial [Acidimicrobiaceae bacterium]|nr:hypothetical protein [Acidimicrobiaceae bacterium]